MDKVRNGHIRGSLKVAPVTEKLKENRLSRSGHVKRRDETHVTKRVLSLHVDGWRGRGRPKKRWMDCVRRDMEEKGDSVTHLSPTGQSGRKKHVAPAPSNME
ncbi:hypothetical protein PYW08_006407 [Mythimna loreyi]|uniref:Uncharacterized protein n=1 Tax=Mythimna loreyi TaxID=667449 RepID=A0ACC2QMI1_9NEOP|nr:hypothetical protein PYW08_006407 [Mythimna loreyi]